MLQKSFIDLKSLEISKIHLSNSNYSIYSQGDPWTQ